MIVAHLKGRVGPEALEGALSADFAVADPDAVLCLRDGNRAVSPATGRRRGVLHFPYRVALAPEVSARAAFEEGWIDALATEQEWKAREESGAVSNAARASASRLLDVPSISGALALERAHFALLQAASDKIEGIGAFFEKRPPRFPAR
jgi:enoyl-CoA hydratase/carnithine racemase